MLNTIQDHAYVINNNNFVQNSNQYLLRDYQSVGHANINAQSNWWGTANGSNIASLIYDNNTLSTVGIIDASSYLTALDTSAPLLPPQGVGVVGHGSGTATVSWTANSESDLGGYKIYYGSTSGYPYHQVIDVGNVTTYNFSGLTAGAAYFAVAAYDSMRTGSDDVTNGHESWISDEIFAYLNP